MTRVCHEVTEAVKDKENLIEEVKELGGRASASDSMAYLRILREEDMEKAKDIIKLIKETQAHKRGKYAFIAKKVVIFATGNKLLEISVCLCYPMFYCLGNVGAGDVF
ncbi:hypothetical protein Tco_0945700 [Tanacetum coccineum]